MPAAARTAPSISRPYGAPAKHQSGSLNSGCAAGRVPKPDYVQARSLGPAPAHEHITATNRGTKSKPIPGPHLVYGFLTTSPNAIVEPIHPKAMPVILLTDEERDV